LVDYYGYRARIGIAVPSTNTTVQPESEALRPPGVTNHIARIAIQERKLKTEQDFMEHVQAMRDGMRDAIDRVGTAGVDHIIMGVALEAFWGGVEQAAELQAELSERAGVGISMGSTATVAALEKLNARRIAVLTPHMPRGDEQVQTYFTEAGYEITQLIGLKCPSPVLIAHTTAQEIRDALTELNRSDPEVIVQVGTNLPGMEIATEAERWLGKPVLSINAVTYWDSLRRLGIEDRVTGYGSILEEF
jgi:maleate isomerase